MQLSRTPAGVRLGEGFLLVQGEGEGEAEMQAEVHEGVWTAGALSSIDYEYEVSQTARSSIEYEYKPVQGTSRKYK